MKPTTLLIIFSAAVWQPANGQERAENTLSACMKVNLNKSKAISPMLMGCFFEDINYSADGGIYAELVQNRDFEYSHSDYAAPKDWDHDEAWSVSGDMTMRIDSIKAIHPNNNHYGHLTVGQKGGILINEGFDGISIKSGEQYEFSIYLIGKGDVSTRVVDKNGMVVCQGHFPANSRKQWKQYTIHMEAKDNCSGGKLEVCFSKGTYKADLISLFPTDTFKGRRNGLRKDLAQLMADIHPRFLRFPGGCVAHGDGVHNIYDWKGSIGPLYARRPIANIGGYHQTRGLGYYEYFQLCEDIGAQPLPVVAAGVTCQNTRHGYPQADGTPGKGQQAIPMAEMPDYVQDVLDLIEWATADPAVSKWARMRAEAGHPEPFQLNFLGIGNEDAITDDFKQRFTMIYKAVKEKHPHITLIGTVGPDLKGRDFEEGWAFADSLRIDMVDEHGYRPAQWFVDNQQRYDSYDRNKPTKVYLGEWGTSQWGARMTLEGALAEAIHITALERNADVVKMASFAPMYAKESRKRWVADMIYFTNDTIMPTASYWVQMMSGQNGGDIYIPSEMHIEGLDQANRKKVAHSLVKDSNRGDFILKIVNLTDNNILTTLPGNMVSEQPKDAQLWQLTGKSLNQRDGDITQKNIKVGTSNPILIPPHSYSVFRIHEQKQE